MKSEKDRRTEGRDGVKRWTLMEVKTTSFHA